MNTIANDANTRKRALDPTQSFIVQAPAGSGKTELLTQRYLRLLAHAQAMPEEIIAITFTRKAASEMRERVLAALEFAQSHPKPEHAYQQTTWALAKEVLQKNQQLRWQLLQQPNRLRILTIDALCAQISAQLPILAKFGAQPKIAEDATSLYQQAVHNLLTNISQENTWNTALKTLLLHLDNRASQVAQLLIHILSQREQWLPYVIGYRHDHTHLKNILEDGLKNIALECAKDVKEALNQETLTQLIHLAYFAASQLNEINPEHPLCCFNSKLQNAKQSLKIAISDLPNWQALTTLLLTQNGQLRKSITKREGFPSQKDCHDPSAAQKKAQMVNLLAQFRNNPLLEQRLAELQACPPIHYDTQQWTIITALTELLPILVAQLHVIFAQHQTIDFVELNLAAIRALGQPDNPTDLALYFDYQIRHLLVDEFQDTSITQFRLLEHLIMGWEPDDGRSVFLVGDPMQSIYRFRHAEVALFLRTQQQGISTLGLENLTLRANFRSESPIVDWVNQSFNTIFPAFADAHCGAVPYAHAVATHQVDCDAIYYNAVVDPSGKLEAQQIVACIQKLQTEFPKDSIAILVRSRSHLNALIPALQSQQMPYQAQDIDVLDTRAEIQDLMILTRALLHFDDRTAWFALLRAPWCGLTLSDLLAINQHHPHQTLWQIISDYHNIVSLSDTGKTILQRFVPIITEALSQRGRLLMSEWLYGIWLTIGGPATLAHANALSNVNVFFKLVSELEQAELTIKISQLEDKLRQLYANTTGSENHQLMMMTIHKSKGLEFDHVIIPQCHRTMPNDPSQILAWLEKPNTFGHSDLVLAPIKSSMDEDDPIYRYIRRIEKQKLEHEAKRLLYVAATRAKRTLHFFATLTREDDALAEIQSPSKGSFLQMLWPLYQKQFMSNLTEATDNNTQNINLSHHTNLLTRLHHEWKAPLFNDNIINIPAYIDPEKQKIDLLENTLTARHTGTVVHLTLAQIAHEGLDKWQNYNHEDLLLRWRKQLQALGVPTEELTQAAAFIHKAIDHTLQDKRGQWILSQEHSDAHNEYALTAVINNKIEHIIIDRCFVDNTGTQWIIDYKTATPQNGTDTTQFLQQQHELHHKQLQRYAQAMAQLTQKPIKCGLYFPLWGGWLEFYTPFEKEMAC